MAKAIEASLGDYLRDRKSQKVMAMKPPKRSPGAGRLLSLAGNGWQTARAGQGGAVRYFGQRLPLWVRACGLAETVAKSAPV
jgi:hypothetical protein